MSLTTGVLSITSLTDGTAVLAAGAATGGTSPYTYQWYMSTTTGFTPGAGNLLTGKTTLAPTITGLAPGTTYFFKVVSTDVGNSNATVNSLQLSVLVPLPGALSVTSKTETTASLASAAATGGVGAYTYQWYQSTTQGFTPGGGNLLSGKTSLTASITGLTAGVEYFFKVVVTDSGQTSTTATSNELAVGTFIRETPRKDDNKVASADKRVADVLPFGQPVARPSYYSTASSLNLMVGT